MITEKKTLRLLGGAIAILIMILGMGNEEKFVSCCILSVSLLVCIVIDNFMSAKPERILTEKDIRSLQGLSILTLLILIFVVIMSEIDIDIPLTKLELNHLVIAALSLFFTTFSSASAIIPYNKFFGLRLPWIVKNEATWKYAHTLLAQISFTLAILQTGAAYLIDPETVMIWSVLTWFFIPSFASYMFSKNLDKENK